MIRPRGLILTLLSVLLACPMGRAATVSTRDGQLIEGDVAFVGDAVKVTPRDGGLTLQYPLSNVAAISYRPPLTGVLSGGELPGEWAVRDVGSTGVAGSAEFDQGTFSLRGEGAQLGRKEDAFHYVYRKLPGDGQLMARVLSLSDTDPNSLAGLMIRQSPEAESRYAFIGLTPGGQCKALFKSAAGREVAIAAQGAAVKFPCWLKLFRQGTSVVMAQSQDGKTWQQVYSCQMAGMTNACLGLVVASQRPDELATGTFDRIRITVHGIKAEYFGDARMEDLRVTRIDPNIDFQWGMGAPDVKMPSADFTVRWTGQIKAPSTDAYTFQLRAGEGGRLYVNDQLVATTKSPNSKPMNLVGNQTYRIRAECYRGSHGGGCQLYWSNQSEPQAVIVPSDVYYYAPERDALDLSPAFRFAPVARGLMLVDGSFLPGAATAMDNQSATFRYRDRQEVTVPLDHVARLTFQPLANFALLRSDKGPGVLTQDGDYIEGDCQGITKGLLSLNSIVFGVREFELNNLSAVVLRSPAQGTKAAWVIHTTSGGVIRATGLKATPEHLILQESILGDFPLNWNELIDIAAADAPHP